MFINKKEIIAYIISSEVFCPNCVNKLEVGDKCFPLALDMLEPGDFIVCDKCECLLGEGLEELEK